MVPAAPNPDDAEVAAQLLKEMGVESYEPNVIPLLVARMRGYASSLLLDAKDYAAHANRKTVEVADVRLAVQERSFMLPQSYPQRKELIQLAEEINRNPLPPIPQVFGVRLPPPELQLTSPCYNMVPGREVLPKRKEASAQGSAGHSGGAASSSGSVKRDKQISVQVHTTDLRSLSENAGPGLLAGAGVVVGPSEDSLKRKATEALL
ncbi:unnamed protein product [Chrysoparadoxa australica]